MRVNKNIKFNHSVVVLLSTLCSNALFADNTSTNLNKYIEKIKQGHAVIQLGNFWSQQGKTQHIDIDGLIGNEFTNNHNQSSNGFVGLGYYFDGQNKEKFKLDYGINAFYLAKTTVTGNIIQEGLFNNLAYGYHVTNVPVYAAAKATIPTSSSLFAITFDAGIGPNFMQTSDVHESSLDGVTLPDHIFSGNTTTTFSATAGAGIKLTNVFGKAPLECGYRFFYLGQGHFNNTSNQVVNTLNTGTNYANAVMCAITI